MSPGTLLLFLAMQTEVTGEGAQTPQTSEVIVVTASRVETRLSDSTASVVVLDRETLQSTAAATIDDALRQVPGFTLFRRSGSRVANPTTQGVSLRGIGASGASRALVLDDGIPLNDPFGGWIYWGRVPTLAVDRVEILRGGASDLYGSGAMGGVIQFIRRKSAPRIAGEVSAGSERTGSATVIAGGEHGNIVADFFNTNGYVLVDPDQRGPVDVEAGSQHIAVDGKAFLGHSFVRGAYYSESRDNGTPLQTNETSIRQVAAGTDAGRFSARAFYSDQDYFQTFSAIAADRASERLTVEQNVPSRGMGGSALWSQAIADSHALIAGGEVREVRGTSDELAGANRTVSSGRQRTGGFFLEDVYRATDNISITGGLRFDSWRNFDARRNDLSLPTRSDSAISPRLSVLVRATERLSLVATGYRAFRAPTLNELYRGFRVGNVVTLANDSLGPERLTAIELGARGRGLRTTLFWMETDGTVANVTLSSTPTLITRQRQNLGRSRTRGAEVEGEWRFGSRWRASAGYLYSDAAVTEGPLRGKRLPQVPRSQLTAQLLYTSFSTFGAQGRWSGRQFDDDANAFPLRSYGVIDVFASRPIKRDFAITAALENVFDRRYEAGATPVITQGQPRALRIGVRFER